MLIEEEHEQAFIIVATNQKSFENLQVIRKSTSQSTVNKMTPLQHIQAIANLSPKPLNQSLFSKKDLEVLHAFIDTIVINKDHRKCCLWLQGIKRSGKSTWSDIFQ